MAETEKRFLLLYGTQTGQSKAIAEEVVERCGYVGIDADIHCFSKIEKEFVLENEKLVVIVISSTGDGEPPDSVLKCWRRIKRRTLKKDHFSNMQYTLLGLGDSNYNSYCRCPHMLDDRLQELGATHFMTPGFADDAVGLEIVAEPWIDQLVLTLCNMMKLPPPSQDNKAVNAVLSNDVKEAAKPEPLLSDLIATNLTLVSDIPSTGACDTVDSELHNGSLLPHTEAESEEPTSSGAFSKPSPAAGWAASIPVSDADNLNLPIAPPSYIQIDYLKDTALEAEDLPIQNSYKLPFANSPVYASTVKKIMPLTTVSVDFIKKTLLVELDSSEFTDYKSGDSFGILAENCHQEVAWLFVRLAISDGECPLSLSVNPQTTKKRAIIPEFINNPSTLKEIFSRSLDIRHCPKKAFVKLLADHCSDTNEKRRMLFLSSKQGADLYRQLITEEKRGLLDILEAFPSCTPSIVSLLENLPRLLPRPYSVASASGATDLRFAFNVLDLPPIGSLTDRHGLVTGRFSSMMRQPSLPKVGVYLRTQQHFRLPSDHSVPLILIGPGTGVAPFIGFIEDRKQLLQSGETLGECILFFGNRLEEDDYLFRRELSDHLSIGSLSELHVCFSRDTNFISKSGAKYVTDLLKQQSRPISGLITKRNAYIYVCGDAKNMAKDTNQTITDLLKRENGYTDDEVLAVMKRLRDEKRYKEDVWT